MKIALLSPWQNAWVPLYKDAFARRGHECINTADMIDADIYIHAWADARHNTVKGKKNIIIIRRYELYECGWHTMDFSNVSDFVCVNDHIAEYVKAYFAEQKITIPVHVIYNSIDTKDWTFKVRRPNKNVGMACHIHPKKNIPLALQILAELPEDYALHIAGGNQDQWMVDYLSNFAECVRRKVYIYGQIPFDQMDLWWEQMGVCLSTSYTEGNPNNVIQAMAKGIKPLVHIWPGAIEQFPESMLFATVREAAEMIQSKQYDSQGYRDLAVERFGLANIEKVVDLCLEGK